MKAKSLVWVAVMALALTVSAMAAAQEGKEATNLGSWVSSRITAVSFQEKVQNISTTSNEFAFVLADTRGGVNKIFSNLMYSRGVYLIYENDTANATLLQPDSNGIYVAKLDKTGEWHIVVQASPLLPIPVCGNMFFPPAQKVINIEKRYAIPLNLIMGGCIVLIAGVGGYIVYREHKKKKLKEK